MGNCQTVIEWLNLTQLTVDGHVNIIVDNTEHSHDSGIH